MCPGPGYHDAIFPGRSKVTLVTGEGSASRAEAASQRGKRIGHPKALVGVCSKTLSDLGSTRAPGRTASKQLAHSQAAQQLRWSLMSGQASLQCSAETEAILSRTIIQPFDTCRRQGNNFIPRRPRFATDHWTNNPGRTVRHSSRTRDKRQEMRRWYDGDWAQLLASFWTGLCLSSDQPPCRVGILAAPTPGTGRRGLLASRYVPAVTKP